MRYFNYTLYMLWAAVALLYAQPADAIRRNPNTAAAIHLAQQKNIGLQSITENAARAHVGFLAHDLMEGRQAGVTVGPAVHSLTHAPIGIAALRVSLISATVQRRRTPFATSQSTLFCRVRLLG